MAEEAVTCGICLETNCNTPMVRLRCGHEFCQPCLKSCLQNSHSSCPNCRSLIDISPDCALYQRLLCLHMFGSDVRPTTEMQYYWRFNPTTGVIQFTIFNGRPNSEQKWYYLCYHKGMVDKSDKYRWDVSSWKHTKRHKDARHRASKRRFR